jgi:tetratricopeptide (TPR) repeat protein
MRGAMMKSLTAVALLLCLALAVPRGAQAESTSAHEQQAAAHFERGVELYREGSLDAALVEFERAYELIPNYRLLYNLGQIQAERHEYATAVRLFEQYLTAGGSELSEERRGEVQREMDKLRGRVSYLFVESNVDGARLFVDDAPVGTLPLASPVPINAGVSNVRLEKPGYLPTHYRLKVAGGERPRLSLTLVEVTRGSTREATSATQSSPNYLPFWISSAATVALGGATLGLGLTARAADQDLDAELERVPADTGAIDDARSRLKMYAALTDACAVASLVALGVAVYYLIDPPRKSAQAPKDARRTARILPSERGIGLRARF